MLKELNEAGVAIGATVNAVVGAAEDGKLNGNDLPLVFRPLTLLPEGLKDADMSFKEAANADESEIEKSGDLFRNELNKLTSATSYDMSNVYKCAISVGRMIERAREEGKQEGLNIGIARGRAQAFAQMNQVDPLTAEE